MRPAVSWLVRPGDPEHVRTILAGLPGIEVGRVFVNGRPGSLDDEVQPGDRIDFYPPRVATGGELPILAEREGVVLVEKPAGLATETTRHGEDSVVRVLQSSHVAGGDVHAATRLDVAVSGVVACCLSRDARRRFEQWRERGQVVRTYLALARPAAIDSEGEWSAPLARGRDRAGRDIVRPGGQDALDSRTRFRVLDRAGLLMLELSPLTGRMHQLRAHAALAGAPLVGDRLYGGASSLVGQDGRVLPFDRVALHCWRIEVPGLVGVARVPEELRNAWRSTGGADSAWPDA